MVNVALIISFFCFYLASFYKPSKKDIRWYKTITRFYGRQGLKVKKLPKIPSYFFTILWYVLYILIAISLYIYFNGNCFFDRHRIFNEDDELENKNYEKGMIVLVLAIIDALLNKLWPYIFFKQKKYGMSLIMVVIMLALHCAILWAMATTEQCRRDTFENRYWVSFALYLIYTVWLVIAFIMNAQWFRILGWKISKKDRCVLLACNESWRCRKEKVINKRLCCPETRVFMEGCGYPKDVSGSSSTPINNNYNNPYASPDMPNGELRFN